MENKKTQLYFQLTEDYNNLKAVIDNSNDSLYIKGKKFTDGLTDLCKKYDVAIMHDIQTSKEVKFIF